MPAVFSPGEAETRPLDPEAIVYTTAQKVADLLGIGPGEAVLIKTDTATDGVYVTGADYRDHGFTVGDSVTIYSDNDPMGFTITVDSIESSSSGVKLVFDDTFPAGKTNADYTVALNTYVQNQASFTNGKTRGVTRDHVEQRIKEVQDKIDNLTHNAWRPSAVMAEYINFDTYKPYRRRYYTDYVGTSPLLFRNVQQILRLEVWQGDDYRELAGAEVRLEVVDHAGLSGDSIYLTLGNGSIATLEVGTESTKWRADFDRVSTAQNLADLINKEDRVSKASVEFSPSFTLEGSSSNIAVHDEVLATANSDYGNGKVKLTSKRQTKGGEALQIAATDLTNLSMSQYGERSTKTRYNNSHSGWSSLDNGVTVLSYPAPDATLTIGNYLSGYTRIILDSAANDPATVFTVGQEVFTPDGNSMGIIALFGGGAGAYQIYFEGAIPSDARPSIGTAIHDFKRVDLDTSGKNPIANGGYLASGDSSPIYDASGAVYGTVTAASDGATRYLSFSAPVSKLTAGAKLYNRAYFDTEVTGGGILVGGHTYTAGETIYDSAGTAVGTFASYVGDDIRLSDTSSHVGQLHYQTILESSTLYVESTDGFPSKGFLMVVNGEATNVYSYTTKGSNYFGGIASVSGASISLLNNSISTVSQYYFKTDIGAFSGAGGDQARRRDWWMDHEMGIIYFNNSYPYFEWNAIKVSYIYGERYLEKAIEEVATKMVAVELLMADDRSVLIPEGTQNVDLGSKIQLWRNDAEKILSRYKEIIVFA